MLSRTNSDTRIRRAKSLSSAKRGQTVPFDSSFVNSETSYQHAITAAHIAMGRASERQSKDLSRSDSTTSKNKIRSAPSALQFVGEPNLRRHGSVIYTKTGNPTSTIATPTKHPYPPSDGMLTPLEDEFDLHNHYGSLPSSYRRLRKARSTLTPQQYTQKSMRPSPRSVGSRMTLRTEHRHQTASDYGLRLGLRRSISFLKSRKRSLRNLHASSRRSQTQNQTTGEAVKLAREQYIQDIEEQKSRPIPSSLASSSSFRSRRPPRVFRRTVRSSRTTDFGDAIASENQHAENVRPAGSRIRNFSRGLRDKMNRFFGRTSSHFEDFPSQQVDASRAYFGNFVDSESTSGQDPLSSNENDPYHRESIYIPSSQVHLIDDGLVPHPPSLRSARSTESLTNNNRSRVTSWTDSTVADTIATRLPVERKRLSVIKETGSPHQPSSSAGMHKYGIPLFQTPLYPQDDSGTSHSLIDSQRVYSALLKRLDSTERDQIHQDPNHTFHAIPDRRYHGTGYLNSSALANVRVSRTIRTVPSSGSFHSSSAEVSFPEQDSNEPGRPPSLDNESTTATAQSHSYPEEKSAPKHPILFPRNSSRKSLAHSPCKLDLPALQERSKTPVADVNSSVVISQPNQNTSATSVSVYSRTTSGNTPIQQPHSEFSLSDIRQRERAQHAIHDDLRSYWLDRQKNRTHADATTASGRPTNHHYREPAQIFDDNEDGDSAIGAGVTKQRLRYVFSPASSPSPKLSRPRFPLRELKQSLPKRNDVHTDEPAQNSVGVEDFVGARSGWSGRTGSATPTNDENAKIVLPKRSQGYAFPRRGKLEDKRGAEEENWKREGSVLLDSDTRLPSTPSPASKRKIAFQEGDKVADALAQSSSSKKYDGDVEDEVSNSTINITKASTEPDSESDSGDDSDKENRPQGLDLDQPPSEPWKSNGDMSYLGGRAQGPVLSRNRRLVSDFLRSRRRRGFVGPSVATNRIGARANGDDNGNGKPARVENENEDVEIGGGAGGENEGIAFI